MHLSPNFTLRELCHSNTAKKFGIINYPYREYDELDYFVINNLSRLCSIVLEPLREFTKTGTLHINSGYRCPQLNKIVKGAIASNHMSGLAVDVPISQFERFELVDRYIQKRVGTIVEEYIKYKTFIHISLKLNY